MLYPQFTPPENRIYAIIPKNVLHKGIIMHDIIGKKFGKWIVISTNGRNKKGELLLSCKCECGTVKDQRMSSLTTQRSIQCKQCYMRELNYVENLIGKQFGSTKVLEKIKDSQRNEWFYKCICITCNTIKNIPGYRLKNGQSNKCPKCRVKTHGMSYTSTFKIWSGILARCLNPKIKCWKYYGGRGIKVCKRWLSFENFLEDMGIRPQKLTIDRIDNDGNYEPGNCRWVTTKENNSNRVRKFIKKGN
jgi:hypothetical protein